jgi:hypothetical protein
MTATTTPSPEPVAWSDPRKGSFWGTEPLGFNAGDSNLCRYVGNDPANERDPSGLESIGDRVYWRVGGGVFHRTGPFWIGHFADSSSWAGDEYGTTLVAYGTGTGSNSCNTPTQIFSSRDSEFHKSVRKK